MYYTDLTDNPEFISDGFTYEVRSLLFDPDNIPELLHLLESKKIPNRLSIGGFSILHYALYEKMFTLARAIAEKRPDLIEFESDYGINSLDILAKMAIGQFHANESIDRTMSLIYDFLDLASMPASAVFEVFVFGLSPRPRDRCWRHEDYMVDDWGNHSGIFMALRQDVSEKLNPIYVRKLFMNLHVFCKKYPQAFRSQSGYVLTSLGILALMNEEPLRNFGEYLNWCCAVLAKEENEDLSQAVSFAKSKETFVILVYLVVGIFQKSSRYSQENVRFLFSCETIAKCSVSGREIRRALKILAASRRDSTPLILVASSLLAQGPMCSEFFVSPESRQAGCIPA